VRGARDRGSVTAETALVLPVLVVVLAMAVWVLAAVGAQLRCVDAAAGCGPGRGPG
jgi:Flp pilus assembly protein TadG